MPKLKKKSVGWMSRVWIDDILEEVEVISRKHLQSRKGKLLTPTKMKITIEEI